MRFLSYVARLDLLKKRSSESEVVALADTHSTADVDRLKRIRNSLVCHSYFSLIWRLQLSRIRCLLSAATYPELAA